MRWFLVMINSLLFLFGLFLVGYAIYLLSTEWAVFSHHNNVLPIVMFLSFGILLIVTALGLLGACNLSRRLLISYSVASILCLIFEIALIVVVASQKVNQSWIEDGWQDLSTNDKEWIEDQFKCCGLNSNYPDEQCVSNKGYDKYCYNSLKDYFDNIQKTLLAVSIVLLFIQIFGLICAIGLTRTLKGGQRVRDDSYLDDPEPSYYNQLTE